MDLPAIVLLRDTSAVYWMMFALIGRLETESTATADLCYIMLLMKYPVPNSKICSSFCTMDRVDLQRPFANI
jgi:hypothetical protein